MIFLDEKDLGSFLYYKDRNSKGYEIPSDFFHTNTEPILTTSQSIVELCSKNNIPCSYLTEVLGLTKGLSLYEVFSYYFEGKIREDMDMIEAIMQGLINQSDWCFCIKIGVTFCWFRVEQNGIRKLGSMQFSESVSNYTVGRFVKRLRYNFAITGNNISRIKFLYWNEDDKNSEFSKYIFTFDYLSKFFNNIEGLRDIKADSIMKLLSKTVRDRYVVTAESFVDCLIDSFSDLSLIQKEGVLYSTNVYYKDYNICVSPIIDSSKCTYGIMLDTEGVKGSDGRMTNGISELGGLIYCKYRDILLNVDTFECDDKLLNETLQRAIENYRSISGQSKIKKIPVLVYGKTDILMLDASGLNPRIRQTFNFIDVKLFIKKYCPVLEERPTLANIAREFGVKPIYPKHRALNDAKTLFNVLAKILQDSQEFVI